MHRFLGRARTIVATSLNYAETSTVLRAFPDKVRVIPIGISERRKPDDALVNEWSARLGDHFFLFVGALRYYKGIPVLLEAARRSGLRAVIAGDGESARDIAAAGLANVTALGHVSDEDKEALLTLCRALVLPSHLRSEAFGVVLLEAARAGKPMVTTEIGTGTSFVNRDGETGIVVPPEDADALAEAMLRLDDDVDSARNMGRAARRRFERHFRASEMAERYAALYRTVAMDGRGPR